MISLSPILSYSPLSFIILSGRGGRYSIIALSCESFGRCIDTALHLVVDDGAGVDGGGGVGVGV